MLNRRRLWHSVRALCFGLLIILQPSAAEPSRSDDNAANTPLPVITLNGSSLNVNGASPARTLVDQFERRSGRFQPLEVDDRRPTRLNVQRTGDPPQELALVETPSADLNEATIQPDPIIGLMLDQVQTSSLLYYNGILSGESAAVIGGQPYTITTRYTYSGQPIQKATQFVGEHLASLGLDVEYQQWGENLPPNVIGEIIGRVTPGEVFILSAHMDSLSGNPVNKAPGSDDNASGTAAILVAADILSKYQWGCTLRFALWTGEEQGMLGSGSYAGRSAGSGEHIVGVLNMDMVAYDSDEIPAIDLYATDAVTGSVSLANLFVEVVNAYGLDLQPQVLVDDSVGNRSDNKSFWDQGFPAVLAIEDFADFNPFYHTTSDRQDKLAAGYFTEFARAGVGTFVHMSDCLLPNGYGFLEGYVLTAYDGSPIQSATVAIQGRLATAYTITTDAEGYYTRTLPTGTYSVSAVAAGYSPSAGAKIAIAPTMTTSQDFTLELAYSLYLPLSIQDE